MAFTTLKSTQKKFLEQYLRGTGREMSAAQAEATFDIKNLRARVSELRAEGLRIRTGKNSSGKTTYSISRRDVDGRQNRLF